MHCFSSSDPAAVNATLVFDFNNDIGDLWSRSGRGSLHPLPSCSSSSPPLASRCIVCLDQLVYTVCSNLTEGVRVTMEAGEHQVKILKSECPRLRSDDAAREWQLPVAITSILILLFILIGVCLYKYCKRSQSKAGSEGRKSRRASDESSALTDVVTS